MNANNADLQNYIAFLQHNCASYAAFVIAKGKGKNLLDSENVTHCGPF